MPKQRLFSCNMAAIEYKYAWDLQAAMVQVLIARKRRNLELPEEQQEALEHYLLFCEHNPVYTLGRSGKREHLLLSEQELEAQGLSFYPINRGGDITYHGPGQLTIYPLLDLDALCRDVARYIRLLEEVVIACLQDYGIEGERLAGLSGVWLDAQSPRARKICAVGVHLSRWVSMHGLAFNINTNLAHFGGIVPCGIQDKAVTSLQAELGRTIELEEVALRFEQHFARLFAVEVERVQSSTVQKRFPIEQVS